jgi:hypothetical protein
LSRLDDHPLMLIRQLTDAGQDTISVERPHHFPFSPFGLRDTDAKIVKTINKTKFSTAAHKIRLNSRRAFAVVT